MTRLLADIGPLRESAEFRRLWAGTTLSSVGRALTGVAVFATVHQVTRHRLVAVVNRTVIALYGVVAIIAIFPNLLHITKVANRVDAVLLCVVVFLGVNVAWLVLFSPAPAAPEKPTAAGSQPA